MKTASNTGLKFGFNAINAGQRNTTVEPQLIVVSTEGNFRITPLVSKVLGIGHGDNIMFLSNVDEIDAALLNKEPELVEFIEAQGLEVGSPEAMIAVHKEFDQYAIAKGIQEFDTKGNAKTGTERLTKKDKTTFVSQNFETMLEQALDQADDETKDALSRDGITKEEQVELLSAFVTPKEVIKFKGSKAANAGGKTGSGTSLTFTDSNVWKQIKADMGDDATKMNRVFDVDLEDIQDVPVNDGYKTITVKALVLGEYTDKVPNRVGEEAEAE